MLDRIVQELQGKGYYCQHGFLDKEALSGFHQFFETRKFEFVPAKVGKGPDSSRIEGIRGDFTYWLDPLVPSFEFAPLMGFLKELQMMLNQRLFLGLKDYECHLAFYPSGTFYKKHLDRFEKDSSRVLTFVFYLHQDWSEEDGGQLILYNKEGSVVETVLPLPGTFCCFLAEDFPHEVRPARRERRSLTGWMHNKIIY